MIRDLIHYNDFYKSEFVRVDMLAKEFEVQVIVLMNERNNANLGLEGLKSVVTNTEQMLEVTRGQLKE